LSRGTGVASAAVDPMIAEQPQIFGLGDGITIEHGQIVCAVFRSAAAERDFTAARDQLKAVVPLLKTSLLMLMLFRFDFSVIALIGIILLIGIVKKDGIMMEEQRLVSRSAMWIPRHF
jgi:hypothetical protein